MKLPRIGIVDLAVVTVILGMAVLPPREMYASAATPGDDSTRFALALAEARTIAHPQDGAVLTDFARRLGDANQKDWAIEAAIAGATAAKGSPTEWKALLAASVAYVDKIEVVPALDFANRALTTCRGMSSGCPSWEDVRMSIYQQHLDAGIKSGIDPKLDPKGFREAGESALRTIRLNSGERERSTVPPAPQ
ncbi:MAG: hypothetical protein SFX73_24175 [Kofleriaceae bacterium]|nr:hypothetical protein [Kofleriaceae bacterium]